ncbi:MAG: cell division protein FtsL, partial [Bacillota bacterium]|nr:cell division protein FtsL [Bacillota bacterium]
SAKQKKTKASIKPLLRLFVALLAMVVLSFSLISRQAQIVSKHRSINKLRADITALEATNAALQHDVARLSSSSRIETIARSVLGMERPTESQIMKVGVSGSN